MSNDDWFTEAAKRAEKTKAAKLAAARRATDDYQPGYQRARNADLERLRQKLLSEAPTPAERRAAQNAATVFSAVGGGKVPQNGIAATTTSPSYAPARRVTGGIFGAVPDGAWNAVQVKSNSLTPDEALEVILQSIRTANNGNPDDVFRVGGEWMGKITKAISAVIHESESEDDPA